MMGEQRVAKGAFYSASNERHVPDDHQLGEIDRFVDLTEVGTNWSRTRARGACETYRQDRARMRAEAQSRLKSPPLKKGPESRPSRLKGSRSASKYILMFDAFRWGGRRYGGRKNPLVAGAISGFRGGGDFRHRRDLGIAVRMKAPGRLTRLNHGREAPMPPGREGYRYRK